MGQMGQRAAWLLCIAVTAVTTSPASAGKCALADSAIQARGSSLASKLSLSSSKQCGYTKPGQRDHGECRFKARVSFKGGSNTCSNLCKAVGAKCIKTYSDRNENCMGAHNHIKGCGEKQTTLACVCESPSVTTQTTPKPPPTTTTRTTTKPPTMTTTTGAGPCWSTQGACVTAEGIPPVGVVDAGQRTGEDCLQYCRSYRGATGCETRAFLLFFFIRFRVLM